MEGNASVYQVNTVIRIISEGRAEFLRMWRPDFDQNQTPTSLEPPPSSHWIFDSHNSLDKLMHFLPQLSDFVSLTNRIIVSAHRPLNITLLTMIATL